MRIRPRTLLAALAGLALAVAGWYLLAPPQLGGRTSYAVVSGISMEPKLHRGDLVVVRRRAGYGPGDVVLYRNGDLRRGVLHRVLRVEGGRYVFKGDNNDFVDSYEAAAADLVGTLQLRIPKAGVALDWLREPRHTAILAGALATFALLGAGGGSRRRRRRGDEAPAAPLRPGAETLLLAAGALGLLLAGVGLLALRAAPTRTVAGEPAYTQQGSFGYSARVARSAAYPQGAVRSGDPIYLRAVPALDVRFAYRLRSALPHGVRGSVSLDAVLANSDGWRRAIPLAAGRAFSGDSVRVGGTLPLAALGRTIERLEAQTGLHGTYTLTLRPRVRVGGFVERRPLAARLAPSLAFGVDPLRLQLLTTPADGETSNALTRSEPGPATTRRVPARLALPLVSPRVGRARAALPVGLALLAAAAAGLLAARRRLAGVSEAERILARRRSLVVSTAQPRRRFLEADVLLPSFAELERLAERYERLVLHERGDGRDSFLVEEDGVTYRYDAAAAAPPAPAPAGVPRREEVHA